MRTRSKGYLIAGLCDFSYLIFVFTVSRYLAESGRSLMGLGAQGAIVSLCYAFSGILAGRLSDRFGRKPLVLAGVGINCAVLVVLIARLSPWTAYAVSPLVGIAVGMIYPPIMAWITAGTEGRSTLAPVFKFCLSWNAGVICGQATAGYMFPYGPRLPLAVAAVTLAVVFVITLTLHAPATAEHRYAHGKRSVMTVDSFRRHSFLYAAWFCNVAGAVVVSTVLHLFPHLVTRLGIDPRVHGLMLAANRVSIILTYIAMYYSSFWKERLSLPAGALALALMGTWILATADSAAALTLGLVLIGVLVGSNYLASALYSVSLFEERERGLASGLHEASLALGFGIGTIGGGMAGTIGERAPYYLGMIVLTVAAVGLLAIRTAAVLWQPPPSADSSCQT